MNLSKSEQHERCPMVRFVDLVSGKWAIPILYRLILIGKPVRFSELQRGVAPITQKELTKQLRAFEQKGLVHRRVYAEVPPRVEYEVTAIGKTLRKPLESLATWMSRHGPDLAGSQAPAGMAQALRGPGTPRSMT